MENTSYAVVTGASQGIGRAIATELASRGYNLVLVARTESLLKQLSEEIEKTYNVKTAVCTADLSDPGSPGKIFDFCTSHQLNVSILVNNAGYAVFGLFHEIPIREQLDMLQVNNTAMVNLCHSFIPMLKNQAKSYILNISSTSAYQAVPAMSIYAASKAFVITFTRGLQMELAGTNTHVCCMVPGPTDTNFISRAKMGPKLKAMSAKFEWPADKVARIAVKGMFKGAVEVIPGLMNQVSYIFVKLLPKRFGENIAAGIYMKAVKEGR